MPALPLRVAETRSSRVHAKINCLRAVQEGFPLAAIRV